MKRKIFFIGAAALGALMTGLSAGGQAIAAPVYLGVAGGNVAVSGYDPVSYFAGNGVPQKGNVAFSVKHDGAVYQFANAANAAKFTADPDAFMPQFGGHCAWAMARGYLAPADPQQYAVVDGKLYLNFNAEVKAKWDKDRVGFIKSAHGNWKKVPADAKFGG